MAVAPARVKVCPTAESGVRSADGALTVDAYHESGDDHYRQSREISERVSVPEGIDRDAIEASYRNGVLEVYLPADVAGEDEHRINVE